MSRSEEEEYNKWKNNSNSKWNSVSQKIQPIHIFGVLFGFFIFYYFYSSNKINVQFFFGGLICLIALVAFMLFQPSNEEKLLPEHVIKRIAYEALERKRLEGKEIPSDSQVMVNLVGQAVFEQDFANLSSGIIRRDVGFTIIHKGLKKRGVISIHPYSGIVLSIRLEPLGYRGTGVKDRMIVPVNVYGQKETTNSPKMDK